MKEEWAEGLADFFGGPGAVVDYKVVGRMMLDHRVAFEFSIGGEIAQRANMFFYAIVRETENDCCGEEGFFVAFTCGALTQDWVVVLWAVNVVVGC